MNWKYLLVLAVAMLVVGCSSNTSAPTTTTPTAPTTPSVPEVTTPMVDFVSVPDSVEIGKPIMVSWQVSGTSSVTATAIKYGLKTQPAEMPAYTSMAPKVAYTGDTSQQFSTSFVFGDKVTVYMRAYAMVDGKEYWSAEKAVQVVVPAKKVAGAMVEESSASSADDSGAVASS